MLRIFFIKQNGRVGGIDIYKARLVSRGCWQKYYIDYKETFAPVVRYDSIRTLLAIITTKDLEIFQFDAKTAPSIYKEIVERS